MGAVEGEKAATYLALARNMTQACYQLYNATATGLGAERIEFNPDTKQIEVTDRHYYQRPEVRLGGAGWSGRMPGGQPGAWCAA